MVKSEQSIKFEYRTELTKARELAFALYQSCLTGNHRFLISRVKTNESLYQALLYSCGYVSMSYKDLFKLITDMPFPEGHIEVSGRQTAVFMPISDAWVNPYKPIGISPDPASLKFRVLEGDEFELAHRIWSPLSDKNKIAQAFLHYLVIGSIPFFILIASNSYGFNNARKREYVELLSKMVQQEELSYTALEALFEAWCKFALNKYINYNELMRMPEPWEDVEDNEARFYAGSSFKDVMLSHGVKEIRRDNHRFYKVNWQLGQNEL